MGEENKSITGGFVGYNYKSSTSGATDFASPTITEGAEYLTFKRSSSAMGTVFSSLAIDLTNYSKIKINRTATSGGSSNYTCTFGLTTEIKNKFVVTKSVSVKGSGDIYLDTSDLTGSYHLYFMMYSATLKIYSLALVK